MKRGLAGLLPPKPKTVASVLATFTRAANDLKEIAERCDFLILSKKEEILTFEECIKGKRDEIFIELAEKGRALEAAKNIEKLIGS